MFQSLLPTILQSECIKLLIIYGILTLQSLKNILHLHNPFNCLYTVPISQIVTITKIICVLYIFPLSFDYRLYSWAQTFSLSISRRHLRLPLTSSSTTASSRPRGTGSSSSLPSTPPSWCPTTCPSRPSRTIWPGLF